ncbi:hypothetical protein MTR_2g055900 [Medicago truncatula]|uniref:Nucleic acid-binding protein n=1 Tax=Medicago truncatula TaxID=3880 RepID=A0A072V7J3_MEDTR|nr:hypothetical protein MTR_2g055900 [Medicago truncatula]
MEDDEEVARGFDKIIDIDQSKDVWVLVVRIVDLWPVIGKYKSEHLEMIVKDVEQDFPDIPMTSFNFKDFGEVLAGKHRRDLLVDVIGAFQEVTNTNRGNGRLRSITFTLKDASGNILHCCLWDDHAKLCADEFDKFDGTQPQPYVILVKHARVKPEQDIRPIGNLKRPLFAAPYPLCFTNTWDGTRVMFNPPLLDFALFKEKFKDLPSDALSLSQIASQYSQASQFSQNTDIMCNTPFSQHKNFI